MSSESEWGHKDWREDIGEVWNSNGLVARRFVKDATTNTWWCSVSRHCGGSEWCHDVAQEGVSASGHKCVS